MASSCVSDIRIVRCNLANADGHGDYVLYWMTAFARTRWNFSLQRAVEWTRELNKPLVLLHTLFIGDRWDSDRLHGFAIDGMRDIASELSETTVRYYPYVEPRKGAGRGLVRELARRACVVVTDDFPADHLQRLISAEADRLGVLLEKVDSNGLLPLRAVDRVFLTAAPFRRFLQKNLESHLEEFPHADPIRALGAPLAVGRFAAPKRTGPARETRSAKGIRPARAGSRASVSKTVLERWPPASKALLEGDRREIRKLSIDHSISPVKIKGGMKDAELTLKDFVRNRLDAYAELRNHPDDDATSGLSPYLHFGHVSTHQILKQATKHEGVSSGDLSQKLGGKGKGWWGGESAQAFTDQLLTWRELGFNMAWQRPDHDSYGTLPEWARRSLKAHAKDRRSYLYSASDLEAAWTHDRLWNAAQNQLVTEGRLHNYLRMLWGKKILEWTASPREALEVMIELNNKYALDGRDPNSYTGILWILGRYDRPWGPRRPVFGTVRYMSSESTLRKLRARGYMERYAPEKNG